MAISLIMRQRWNLYSVNCDIDLLGDMVSELEQVTNLMLNVVCYFLAQFFHTFLTFFALTNLNKLFKHGLQLLIFLIVFELVKSCLVHNVSLHEFKTLIDLLSPRIVAH